MSNNSLDAHNAVYCVNIVGATTERGLSHMWTLLGPDHDCPTLDGNFYAVMRGYVDTRTGHQTWIGHNLYIETIMCVWVLYDIVSGIYQVVYQGMLINMLSAVCFIPAVCHTIQYESMNIKASNSYIFQSQCRYSGNGLRGTPLVWSRFWTLKYQPDVTANSQIWINLIFITFNCGPGVIFQNI